MLWYWSDLQREWLCTRYFYIQISKCLWCGFEDRDVPCMTCVGAIRGFPLLQLFWHYFRMWNHPLTSTNKLNWLTAEFEASNFTQVPLQPSCTYSRLKLHTLPNKLAIVTALGQWSPLQSKKIASLPEMETLHGQVTWAQGWNPPTLSAGAEPKSQHRWIKDWIQLNFNEILSTFILSYLQN